MVIASTSARKSHRMGVFFARDDIVGIILYKIPPDLVGIILYNIPPG